MFSSRRFRLNRSKTLGLLDELATIGGPAASLYLPQNTTPARVGESLKQAITTSAIPPDLQALIVGSQTGAVLFWGLYRKCLILPPFPVDSEHASRGYEIEPLQSLLSHDFSVALILVRLGAYSIGVCRGTELLDSKTGTGLVHGRHKKGGSSQARFARHREKQIEQFLDRVCGHVREHIEPYARSLDYVVYGGARTTILSLRKSCPFLSQFDDRILRMMLNIPEPRRAVLERAVEDVWSTTIVEWHEDTDL